MKNLALIWKHKSSLCSYCYIRRFSWSHKIFTCLNLTCMPPPPVYCKSLLSVPSTCIIVKLSPVISGYSHCVCNGLLNLQRPKINSSFFFVFVFFSKFTYCSKWLISLNAKVPGILVHFLFSLCTALSFLHLDEMIKEQNL